LTTNKVIIETFFASMLTICLLGWNVYSDILSLFLLMSYYFYSLKTEPEFFIDTFFMQFYVLTNIFGVAVIEFFNPYLPELRSISEYNGSLKYIILAHFMTLTSCKWFYYIFKTKDSYPNRKKNFAHVTNSSFITIVQYGGILVLLSLAIYIGFIVKPSFVHQVDRFIYKAEFINPIILAIINLTFYVIPFFILLWMLGKKVSLAIIIIYLIVQVMIGEKFGLLFTVFSIYLIIQTMMFNIKPIFNWRKYIKRNLKKIIVITSVLITLAIFINKLLYPELNLQNYVIDRAAQQGQLWHSIFSVKGDPFELDLENLKNELNSDNQYMKGIYKIMYLVAPEWLVNLKINANSLFAFSTQSSILYNFNYVFLLFFQALFGVFMFWTVLNFKLAILRKSFIRIVLSARLFFIFSLSFKLSMFNKIISFEFLIINIILIILMLKDRSIKNNI
jgi:hypothetical protein